MLMRGASAARNGADIIETTTVKKRAQREALMIPPCATV